MNIFSGKTPLIPGGTGSFGNAVLDKYLDSELKEIRIFSRDELKQEEMNIEFNEHVQLLEPLGFYDYNNLQVNSKAVLSDSGTISEESIILKFNALNIREANERPEAMEETSVMMVGLETERVLHGLEVLETKKRYFTTSR